MEKTAYIVVYHKKGDFVTVIFREKEQGMTCEIQGNKSPLPLKGEFETKNMACIDKYLNEAGWTAIKRFGVYKQNK